ncbi:hypothetical protein T07_13477, partial [Trichinella nelsoni]
LYNIMEEKKKELKNASAHCSTMDASDARCQRWIAKTAFIFFFMAVMHEINADSSALEEAKNYIYQSDLQSGKGHFRRVLDVKDVDTSEGLSLTIDALSTTCPVSSELSQEQVYSDECPTTKVEYDEIECHLKLDHSKTGQLECTYYGA